MVVEECTLLTQETQNQNPTPTNAIVIPRGTEKEVLTAIGTLLKKHPGKDEVEIHLPNGGPQPKIMKLPYTVDLSPQLKQDIDTLLRKGTE